MKSKVLLLAIATAVCGFDSHAVLSLTGSSYTQNFDTLAISGTSSTVPDGWAFTESGSSANTTYAAGSGTLNAGDTYAFGSTGSSDRALGGLQSNNLNPTIGFGFQNDTGFTISDLVISYTGEQWRAGGRTGATTDQLDFQYSLDATSLTSGTWNNFNLLDFISPYTSTSASSRDGNNAANQSTLSGTLSLLNLSAGSSFWIRWQDLNVSGADDGLAIDNFSINATLVPVPEPAEYAAFGALGLMGAWLGRNAVRKFRLA